MKDEARGGLQHVPATTGISLQTGRAGIIARGRQDAARASSNEHYLRAAQHYKNGDYTAAAAAFLLAADEGHAESQYMLSTMYDAGEGVTKDDEEAARWELRAAEQGHAYAQANVSFRLYSQGRFTEAFEWCQRAAHSNLAWAQYNLGLMYRKGEGVGQSDTEAARWYTLAAGQNFAEAQAKLAELYYFGAGVQQSHEQAAAWYRRAADGGSAEAQFQMGHLYATGLGVEPDYTQSRFWTRKAASQGHEGAVRELKRREYRDP